MPKGVVKIYKKTGLPYRKDYELVKLSQKGNEEAILELWDKYFELRQKKRFEFLKICKSHGISYSEDFDGYDSYAFEKFHNQMDGVRIKDIKKPETWSIWIRLNGYWNSMNRDLIGKSIKISKNEKSEMPIGDKDGTSTSSTTNIDIAYEGLSEIRDDQMKKMAQKIVNMSMKKMESELNEKQLKLIKMRMNSDTASKIRKELHVSDQSISQVLDYAKSRLSFWISEYSKKNNLGTLSYNDIVSMIN